MLKDATVPAQRRIFNILHLNFDTSTINNIMVNSYSAIGDRIDSALHDGLYTNCRTAVIALTLPRVRFKNYGMEATPKAVDLGPTKL